MNCSNCGAPLPAKSQICPYCETRNDVDLRLVRSAEPAVGGAGGEASPRKCPQCGVGLTSVALGGGLDFSVDQCGECFGLFFDPHEVETVLNTRLSPTYEVDYPRLQEISDREGRPADEQVRYRPCAVCGKLMNRRNFGARSGVIVDECRDHGIWLDAGELRQLMHWAKAGGRMVEEKRANEQQKQADRKRRRVWQERQREDRSWYQMRRRGPLDDPFIGAIKELAWSVLGL